MCVLWKVISSGGGRCLENRWNGKTFRVRYLSFPQILKKTTMQEPHIYYCHNTNQLTVEKPDSKYEMIFEPPKQCDNHFLGFKVGDFIQGWTPELKDLYATIIILWKAKDKIELVHFQPNELRRTKKFADMSKFRIVKSADDIIAFFDKHRKLINERDKNKTT